MKALALFQPWATAVALGSKRVETRSWRTHYRGPLIIHASLRKNVDEMIYYNCTWNWQGALAAHPGWQGNHPPAHIRSGYGLPFGALIATCDLVDVRPTGTFTNAELDEKRSPAGSPPGMYDWTERQMGNFELGRFGWSLANIKPLPAPIPWKGQRGLFDVPDEALRQALAA